ncbi:Cysteine desulfurase [Nitrosococcus halophilus Nc 4]|uniref:Cysteine desulfurase n=1 Tax=Nitrosococcus halophilus (strain Nc4) TaxID=472759 RepID=D5C4B9_NITHN|nr:cysteine desulfurase family protein [Nitrosococcus halophilus]ADE13307.1 Cysteine desulfurase [Nitrosococcus halophilus Nc 4]
MEIDGTLYFDYQASTPIDPRVLAAMMPFWRESFGNPHASDHRLGWRAGLAVDEACERVARLIGADADEIVFTSGATEANNLALLGLSRRRSGGNRRRILVSAIEHKCILRAAQAVSEQLGFSVELLPVCSNGCVDLDYLSQTLDQDVLLVSVMAMNNEIGTIQDLREIYKIISKSESYFHCDAAQAPVALDLNYLAETADMVSLSGHKMYGPQGVGALYIRRDLQREIEPLFYGGGQQAGLRSGTVPLPLVIGMAKAAELVTSSEANEERKRVQEMRNRFVYLLKKRIPSLVLNGPEFSVRHPGNANLRFPSVAAEDLLLALQPRLAASTGAACTTGIPEPSHVLRAIGLSAEETDASIRFSFGRFTESAHIDEAIELISTAYARLIENMGIH